MTQRPDPHERMVERFFDAPAPQPITAETQMAENGGYLNLALQSIAKKERDFLDNNVTDPVAYAAGIACLNTIGNGGSRFRGSLAMSVYRQSVFADWDTALALGVHHEWVQAYIVIADDEIDGTERRRNQPVAHRQVAAMLLDESQPRGTRPRMTEREIQYVTRLHAEAYQLRAYSEPFDELATRPQHLSEAMDLSHRITARTAREQIRDVSNRRNIDISEEEVLEIYRYKTALYTVSAPVLIARVLLKGTLSEREVQHISAATEPSGIAYQLYDDLKLMGSYYSLDPNMKPDKDEAADVLNGTMTPLALYALRHPDAKITADDRKFVQHMLLEDQTWALDPEEFCVKFALLQAIFHNSGAVDYVKSLAAQHKERARQSLETPASQRALPADLIEFLSQLAK